MGCIDYSSKFYGMVERKRQKLPLDQFNQWLGDTFNAESAESIINAIENGDWSKNFSTEVVKQKVTEVPKKEYSDEGFFTLKPTDRSTLSFYGSETSEGRIAHNKMINTFKTNIIKRLIYDYETKTSPNLVNDINGVSAVNQILFDYKQELMNDLWKTLEIDYSQEYIDDKQFTKQVALTLSAFEKSLHKKDVMRAYESYVILKNFDNLLKSHIDIVKINDAYDGSSYISRDMYEYKGPSMKRDASIGKESADANDYTGSIVKLLLDDYFPEIVNGRPDPTLKIGLVGFNRVMTHVIDWVENSGDRSVFNELNKGSLTNWELILDKFSNTVKNDQSVYMSILKSKLEGIRNYIFAKDANLPYDIINSFNRHVRDVYGQNYSEYVFSRSTSGGNSVHNDITNDYFIDVQLKNVLRVVQSKVDLFRTNPTEFESFCERHNIEIKDNKIKFYADGLKTHRDEPYTIKVVWDAGIKRYQFNREVSRDNVDNKVMVDLLSDLFDFVIPDNYNDILTSINSNSLFDIFYTAMMTTIAAGSNKFPEFKYQWGQQLDTYVYSSDMQSSGKFFAQVYGGETINVVKNKEGNNLPLYSIGSAVRKIKRIINDVREPFINAYSSNIFVRKPGLLGKVITRSQTDMGSTIKSSKDNSIPEIATVEVLHDFHENLYDNNGVIWLQPICYADKSTHTMFEVDTSKDFIEFKENGKTERISIQSALTRIANSERNTTLINAIEQRVFKERQSKIKYLAVEMINRYLKVFKYNNLGSNINFVSIDSDENDIKKIFNSVRELIKKQENVSKLRSLFKNYNENNDIKENLIENYDFGTGIDKKLDVNLMFLDDLNVYLFAKDSSLFKSRIEAAKKLTAQDYWEQDLRINGLEHKSIKENFFTDRNKYWYDPTNYEVFPYKVYDAKTKKAVKVPAGQENSKYFTSSDYIVQLNPIFLSHFLMKLLYGTPMKELMLGSTYAYNSKASFKGDSKKESDVQAFMQQVRAAKIIEETKRALYCGATTTTYLQGLAYGVPEQANVACVSDLQGLVFNPKGDRDQTDVHDGSGWVSPYWAIQTNESLADASVGWNKKTIYGHIDPTTGVFTEIKWAEFALSNQYRKNSPVNREFSAERMFRKMHNQPIPSFKWDLINLTDFYSLSSSVESSKKPGILTHSKPVYYFDINDGKYYEIISITNKGNNIERIKQEVTEKGVRRGEFIKDSIFVQSIYDLDQLFGGAFCKEKDLKTGFLVDSDANNYIVNNIICETHLKDFMIHIVANKSAIKVGQKNLNSDSIFLSDNNDDLQTFKISTKYGGVIMDADHEIEDSEVREMGQLVSALMQEGNSANEAKAIYEEIGEVVYENVKKYISASEDIDKTDLYNKLGDALLRAFATQDRDVIGLAQAFISKFEQGNQKYQIPFSSATIAPAFMSAVSSVLTKQGIRRTFPGVGAVQVPGRGVMMTYKIGNLNYDFEGAVKLASKQGVTLEQAMSTESPFIEQINPEDIDFEDTLIIDGQLVKVADIKTYDYYRNIYKQPILRHNFQPRDLLAPVPKFSVNGKTYSIYDLDAVRKCNYIGSILSKKVKTSDEDIANFAQVFDNPESFIEIAKNKKELEKLLPIYQKEADNIIKQLSIIQKVGTGTIPMQKCFGLKGEEVQIDQVFENPGQIVMGKAYADKLGISKYYNIADIKAKGPRFFENELRSNLSLPTKIDKQKYDAIAYLNDGSKVLIVLGDGFSAADKLGETTEDTTFREINGIIYKNNEEEICEASDIECRKYIDSDGQEYSVFVIKSLDVLDKLNESKLINTIRYNYQMDNYKQLMFYNHDVEINEDGTFTQPLDVIYPIFDPITKSNTGGFGEISFDNLSPQNLLDRLRRDELAKLEKKIQVLANRKFDAFEKSLRFVGTRIPAQSMQSFMPLEVACFTNSELNDVYVPHILTWVAGSDYDIDKLYMMGYSLTDAGELFTYSSLSDYYPIDDVLKLPEPRGRKFIESFDQSTNHITFDELNDFINNRNLSSISRTLNNKTDDIRVSFEFREGVNEKTFNIWKRRFIKTLNTHERSRLNPNSRTSALKNRIVNQIETLMLDPINIINMLNPISTDNAKDAASKTTLGNREKLMNYDVPTSMMIMQYQNMLGKNVIGSAASGLKAYFGELTYFNNIIDQIYNQLINNDSSQNIFENIKRVVFDGKYNSSDIRILGNTPLRKLINILDLKPNFKTLVLDNPSYNSKMQSHLKGYITDNILNFEKLLLDLEKTAWEYNTSQNISEILSAATDRHYRKI